MSRLSSINPENTPIAVPTPSISTVTITDSVPISSAPTARDLLAQDEVGVLARVRAARSLMIEQEAVLELLAENERLAIIQILAGVAAGFSRRGTVRDNLEVGGDTWAVVGDVDGVVADAVVGEAGAEEVAVVEAGGVAAGGPEGWAGLDFGGGCLGGLGVGLGGCCCCLDC